jgi:dTDP-4-amino-4,6-dideoxygalactose transaminase
MYTLLLDNKENKEALQKHLGDNGIASKTYYTPIHLATVYKTRYNYKEGDLPKTEELSQRALTLPMHPGLKKKEINHIVKVIKGFFKND